VRVAEIWRYPVKSLQGERLEAVEVDSSGVRGDRSYALFDATTGFGLTARREPLLLFAAAAIGSGGALTITVPDGSLASTDEELSDWLGRKVHLRPAADTGPRRYETVADFEDEDGEWEPFDGSLGAFHDLAGASLSLLSRDSIGAWDARRFRANLLLDGGDDHALAGTRVAVGGAQLDVGLPIPRCVMTTRPQPGGLERDLDVLRTIHRERGGCLAVGALVHQPGRVRAGDEVS
jgi:uncharacterized protein YcbX